MLLACTFSEQRKRRTEREKQMTGSSEIAARGKTPPLGRFVFLGQCKTGPGAARRPTRVSARRNPTRVRVRARVCVCVCTHGGHCLPLLAGSEKRCWSLPHHQALAELVPADPEQSAPLMARGAKGAAFKYTRQILAASDLAVAPSWLGSAGTQHPQQGRVPPCWLPAAARAGPSTFPGPAAFWSRVTSGILLWRWG